MSFEAEEDEVCWECQQRSVKAEAVEVVSK